MNTNLKQAYDLLKQETGYDKILMCIKITEDKYLFSVDRRESPIDIIIDDGGLYEVDLSNKQVIPHSMTEYIDSGLPKGEEIDPEVFEMNKLFNL